MLISKLYLEDLLSIDKLHYHEVKLLNDLHDLVLEGNYKKITVKLDELVADVKHHFESEEKQMYEYDYPETNKHQYAHGCALKKLLEVREEYNTLRDNSMLQEYLEKQLGPWFTGHVMSMDKLACDYMCEKGSN